MANQQSPTNWPQTGDVSVNSRVNKFAAGQKGGANGDKRENDRDNGDW